MKKCLLTIYILTFNRPEYLEECINSIKKQTWQNYKIVILDNGSSKSYVKVLQKFTEMNIEYYKHKKNIGVVKNFNFGLSKKIDTKYMMFFHDDDIMEKSLLQKSINFLEIHENIMWVGSLLKSFNEKIEFNIKNKYKYYILDLENLIMKIFKLPLHHGSVIYRVGIANQISYEKLAEKFGILCDRPYLFEIIQNEKCAIIKQKLTGYRIHKNQDSKVSPITEEILLNLFSSYRKPIKKKINLLFFYLYSSFHFIESYKNLNNKKDINEFINKGIKLKIINKNYFLLYYCYKIILFLKLRLKLSKF